jgi:hypothetical protein
MGTGLLRYDAAAMSIDWPTEPPEFEPGKAIFDFTDLQAAGDQAPLAPAKAGAYRGNRSRPSPRNKSVG